MSPSLLARAVAPALISAAVLAPGLAQAQQRDRDTIFFKTNVGSFKILGVEEVEPNGTTRPRPAEGKIQITFTGTLLVNKVANNDPKITVSSGLRKEYDDRAHQQVAYHGTGTMTVDGKFTSVQWFGRDMSARWDGFGIARLVGEFDKDLKTGQYWYIENPDDIKDWGTQLKEITNPPKPGDFTQVATPRGRKSGG